MNKIMKAVMFVIVGVILVAGVMTPLLSQMSDNIQSVANNTVDRYVVKEFGDLIVTYEGGDTYEFNGEEMEVDSFHIIICDGMLIKPSSGGICYFVDSDNGNKNITYNAGETVFTLDDGAWSYGRDTIYTGVTNHVLYPSARGSYGCFEYDSSFNVSNGDVAFAIHMGGSAAPLTFALGIVDGAASQDQDVISPLVYPATPYTGTVTLEIDSTPSEDGKSTAYSSIKFSSAGDTVIESRPVTCVFAPLHYDTIDSNAITAKNIVGMVPILLTIMILVGAAYVLMSSVSRKQEL